MQSTLRKRVARLEHAHGTGNDCVLVFDDDPAPTDKRVRVIRIQFVDPQPQEHDRETAIAH